MTNGKQMSNCCYFNTNYDFQLTNGKSSGGLLHAPANGSTLPAAAVELRLIQKLDDLEDVEL